jgi:hypothetical protein
LFGNNYVAQHALCANDPADTRSHGNQTPVALPHNDSALQTVQSVIRSVASGDSDLDCVPDWVDGMKRWAALISRPASPLA